MSPNGRVGLSFEARHCLLSGDESRRQHLSSRQGFSASDPRLVQPPSPAISARSADDGRRPRRPRRHLPSHVPVGEPPSLPGPRGPLCSLQRAFGSAPQRHRREEPGPRSGRGSGFRERWGWLAPPSRPGKRSPQRQEGLHFLITCVCTGAALLMSVTTSPLHHNLADGLVQEAQLQPILAFNMLPP